MSYLTEAAAAARLADLGHVDSFILADLNEASDMIDASGPFIGVRYSDTQARAFPRSVTIAGDTEGVVPERVLNAVVLAAYAKKQNIDEAPIKSESVGDISVTYATSQLSKEWQRISLYLRPYQLKSGIRL